VSDFDGYNSDASLGNIDLRGEKLSDEKVDPENSESDEIFNTC
jgi:hypothetical protein